MITSNVLYQLNSNHNCRFKR